MMDAVQFADILFILLVCIVIFVILTLVNRGKQKSDPTAADVKSENNVKTSEISDEED